ncbi:hypothetical protein ACS0TY_029787 [Phlomoides rotata]
MTQSTPYYQIVDQILEWWNKSQVTPSTPYYQIVGQIRNTSLRPRYHVHIHGERNQEIIESCNPQLLMKYVYYIFLAFYLYICRC